MRIWFYILLMFLMSIEMFGQGRPYEGPDDPAGDIAAEREGYMTGNQVFLYFQNTSELSHWPREDVSKWPNNYDGTKMLDGVALLIGAQVFLENDTVPVTDMSQIMSRTDLDTLYFLQSSYREGMDLDPTGTIEWGFYPVMGYFNENNEYVAMSNIPDSWPVNGWPARGEDLKWPGEWNGRFGRGKIYADLETFFVVNDAQDQEYLGLDDTVKYYPRPGINIGDKNPLVTIQNGNPWGGIGIRVEVRGFQWNNVQARDAIFWEYTIANISDYDLPRMAFGFHVDNGIGGADADDEEGYFDQYTDMAYSWDISGTGVGGKKTGVMGFAFLESPGIFDDGLDNDMDGITDERRDNQPLQIVGPKDGISDLQAFLTWYDLKEENLKEHWDADEDQDWQDGIDTDGDGVYSELEDAGDDIGTDGVAPGDLNYTGPDANGTECNHKPDFIEGVGCEPNFAVTDISESDMLGLTAFWMFPSDLRQGQYNTLRGDKSMWDFLSADSLEAWSGGEENLIERFASGVFPLYQGKTERISMAMVHSYDELAGLNSSSHSAPVLMRKKEVVQAIYETDYRFAQPPIMPVLQASAGDGEVVLTWSDISDKRTREPFLKGVNDFEGYKLYRATDKKFQDAEVITDGFGNPIAKKPIFQCDLIDDYEGFTNFGMINGIGYYLGSNTGITHHYVDKNAQNGRTYYYALVAYDYGIPDVGEGIAPSENNIVIELDEAENIRGIGKNVQIVTPCSPAAGYQSPDVSIVDNFIKYGTGSIEPIVVAKHQLKPGNQYKIKFEMDTVRDISVYEYGYQYVTTGFSIYDVTAGNQLIYQENSEGFSYNNLIFNDSLKVGGAWYFNPYDTVRTGLFDGIVVNISQDFIWGGLDENQCSWKVGNSPIHVTSPYYQGSFFPWDYEIVFTDNPEAYTSQVRFPSNVKDENDENIKPGDFIRFQSFPFYVINKMAIDSLGNYVKMELLALDLDSNQVFDLRKDKVVAGGLNNKGTWMGTAFIFDFLQAVSDDELPKPDDVYSVKFKRPFSNQDSLTFQVSGEMGTDIEKMKSDMDKIKVVPNPYVATNMMEPSVSNYRLNQRRKIQFTHLPSRCVIKIFTATGIFIKEINVNQTEENGSAHWDLKTKEGLDAAAGIYIFHVKALETGYEKIGQFAIIK